MHNTHFQDFFFFCLFNPCKLLLHGFYKFLVFAVPGNVDVGGAVAARAKYTHA